MTDFPAILLERVTHALVGVRNTRRDPHCRSRAAMAAAAFFYVTREAMICREERAALRDELDLAATVATRERAARHELQQQAIAACMKIARKHHRAKRPVAVMRCSNASRRCGRCCLTWKSSCRGTSTTLVAKGSGREVRLFSFTDPRSAARPA